jgi:ABC-2 type transport system ATP-binding protein
MSIIAENIVKRYGNQLALDRVSFSVEAGEITGFLGPNGAGKSTLMRILTGFLIADSGMATIDGLSVNVSNTDFRYRIGYLPEHNPLYHEMYVVEYLRMTAGIYHLKNPLQQVDRVIEMTGLSPEASKKIGSLSKGYKQRVGLAQALIHDPSVLILDEPTTGLDPNQLDEIRSLIKNISEKKTVLLSTHIMQEVEALCNRVIIINKGKIVADGAAAEMKKWANGLGQKVLLGTLERISLSELMTFSFIANVEPVGEAEFLLTSAIEEDIRPELFRVAVARNWTIITLSEQTGSFEAIFRDITRVSSM